MNIEFFHHHPCYFWDMGPIIWSNRFHKTGPYLHLIQRNYHNAVICIGESSTVINGLEAPHPSIIQINVCIIASNLRYTGPCFTNSLFGIPRKSSMWLSLQFIQSILHKSGTYSACMKADKKNNSIEPTLKTFPIDCYQTNRSPLLQTCK